MAGVQDSNYRTKRPRKKNIGRSGKTYKEAYRFPVSFLCYLAFCLTSDELVLTPQQSVGV